MLEQFRFYLSHSFNDLKVNKRLTFFALLSVAAGVAAIVSLQTLALMISNTLEINLQENNRGDISVIVQILDFEAGIAVSEAENPTANDRSTVIQEAVDIGILYGETFNFFGQEDIEYKFSQQGIEAVQAWIDNSPYAGQAEMTYRIYTASPLQLLTGSGIGTVIRDTVSGDEAAQLAAIIVDTDTYPFYGEVVTTDGQTLAEVVQQPTDIVVSETVADTIGLQVGDTVELNGSSATFTVRGIVNSENQVKNFNDVIAGIFGFYYLDWSAWDSFEDAPLRVESLYFRLDDSAQVADFNDALLDAFPYIDTITTDDLRTQNEFITEQIDTFVAVMGLISLLLGSIGIINTMQVVVRRRMLEIAVLKTLGLQSEQITLLFLTEALLVGIIGSIAGILLGWIGTYALKDVVAGIVGTDIPFVLAATPAINGFVVGVIVATVFGFLPTLTAGQIRPGLVLRPAQGVIPRVGIGRSLLALLVIIVSVSLIVTGILGSNFLLAFGIVTGAFVAAGIVFVLLVLIIWIIGRFLPSFGLIDLKISLRQMLVTKSRGASTLLALVVGVFSLSTLTLFAQTISNVLEESIRSAGGNVLVSVQTYNQLDDVEALLANLEGVNGHSVALGYMSEFVSYTDSETGQDYDLEGLRQLVRDSDINFPPFFNGTDEEKDAIQQEFLGPVFLRIPIDARRNFGGENLRFSSGRNLTAEDMGQPRLVLEENDFFVQMGINAGDTVTYNIVSTTFFGSASHEITFEIVGIQKPDGINVSSPHFAPADAFPEDAIPTSIAVLVDIDESQLPALRRALGDIPGSFAIDINVFTRLITSLLGAFTAFPTLVAALGLIVGGVVIANSVALATMERRHEIAVMKSVGLQRERVLGMLLLENSILGFIGGLMGVGYGLIALAIFTTQTGVGLTTIPFGTAFLLMLLCVAVALIAAITSAWDASGEKPLTVLRYE
jgi:ABC-type antimicrobial peptide transport system permease subunit